MWILAGAVLTASLLGSMHCVGMCGPLALWAGGAGDDQGRTRAIAASSLYHAGRLITYTVVGGIAGGLGSLVDLGATTLGFQLVAARIAGALMIAAGLVQLWRLVAQRRAAGGKTALVKAAPLKPSLISRFLLRVRPLVFRLPVHLRGLTVGLLTALLPCGWLYLFALLAAGTGDALTGSLVMAAFWLGSVPALVGLVLSAQGLAFRFRKAIPAVASLLLIAGGCYTASGRGFSGLQGLSRIQVQADASLQHIMHAGSESSQSGLSSESVQQGVQSLTDAPLPCCIHEPADSAEPQP